jgi:hypothetical protein
MSKLIVPLAPEETEQPETTNTGEQPETTNTGEQPEEAEKVDIEEVTYSSVKSPNCFWNIVPIDGDRIIATDTKTNEVFEGTIEEYNAFMKE